MSHDENEEDRGDHSHCHMCGPMKKEFKLAMLEKKETILKAQLDFITKMRGMIEKMSDKE